MCRPVVLWVALGSLVVAVTPAHATDKPNAGARESVRRFMGRVRDRVALGDHTLEAGTRLFYRRDSGQERIVEAVAPDGTRLELPFQTVSGTRRASGAREKVNKAIEWRGAAAKRYREAVLHPEYRPEILKQKVRKEEISIEGYLLRLIDQGDFDTVDRILVTNQLPLSALRKHALANLARQFGLAGNASDLSLEGAVAGAIEAEQVGLRPHEILARKDAIAKYMIDVLGKPILRDTYSEGEVLSFVLNSMRAVKASEAVQHRLSEAERVRTMSPAEWDQYRQGIRWSQSARATEMERDAQAMATALASEIRLPYAGSQARDVDLIQAMRNAPFVTEVVGQFDAEVGYNPMTAALGGGGVLSSVKLSPRAPE